MRQYFKREAESDLGTGVAYLEITDGWPSRQIEIYGDTWLWGDETKPEYLADQPIEALELGDEYAIPADEFETAWREALKRCPRSS